MTKRSLFFKVFLPVLVIFAVGGVAVYLGLTLPKNAPAIEAPDKPVIVAPPSEGEEHEDPEDNVDWDAYCERNFELTPSSDGTYYTLDSAKVNDLEDLVVPAAYKGVPITAIAGHAFQNHTETISLKTAETVDAMGSEVFLNCSTLKDVTLGKYPSIMAQPEDNDMFDDAFAGCSAIENVVVHSGVFGYAFSYAEFVDTENFIFSDSIKSITFGDGVTEIIKGACLYCWGLEKLIVTEGNATYKSSGNCVIDKASKTLILGCKTSVIPNDGSVIEIGNFAFWGCVGLTSITIPSNVTTIGECAFESCLALQSVTISSGVTNIGYHAISGCESLSEITFENGIDWETITIDGDAFNYNAENFTANVHVSSEATGNAARAKLISLNEQNGIKIVNIIIDE